MTGLEKLREIGAHKIYEKTHIAKKFVEDILNENYSSMNKIQFTGFISILEREFGVDLHEVREAYNNRFNQGASIKEEPFVISAQEGGKKPANKSVYIAGTLIFAGILLGILNFSNASDKEESLDKSVIETETEGVEKELDTIAIQEAKANLNHLGNTTVAQLSVPEEIPIEPIHSSKFKIIPRSNLWIGIIDMETFQRTQKLGSEPVELAPDKNWLLVMGHGFVNFELNDEEKRFQDEQKVWFAYEDGVLNKLTRSEFKEKNRGRAW